MRFIHTSDWHVGRNVRGFSRRTEHEQALQQILSYCKEHSADCLLIAGDIFDTSAPSPEDEKLVYDFFSELSGLGVPAVAIGGNHDHPRRLDAVAPLLRSIKVHMLGQRRAPTEGAMFEIESRDAREAAIIARVPWINERDAVDFETLREEPGKPLGEYKDRVGSFLQLLARGYQPGKIRIMLAHLFVDGAKVGEGGGERALHIDRHIYGVSPGMLPTEPDYIALGHVHKNQTIRSAPRVDYSGSLLQLDFGERDQQKYVNLVEVHPRLPAEVTQLPITAGRQMVDVGTPFEGVTLNELAQYRERAETSWLRVFVDIETPVPSLAQLVRAELPSAVHVERSRKGEESLSALSASRQSLGPEELFGRFYESKLGRSHAPAPETLALFRRLLEEERDATTEA